MQNLAPKKALPLANMKKWTTFELFVLGLLLGTLGTTMEGTHKLCLVSLSSWLSWEQSDMADHGVGRSIRNHFESHVLARSLYKIWYSELGNFFGNDTWPKTNFGPLQWFSWQHSMWGLPWMEWFHWEPANYLVFLGCCCHWEFWQNIVMTWHQWIAWEDKQKESRYGKTHTLIFFLLGCLLAFRPHKIRMKIWKHQVWRMDKCVVLGGNG